MSTRTTRGWRVLLGLALVAALTAPAAARETGSGDQEGPAIGSVPPDFTLQATDGSEVSLAGLRGREPVVLVFFRGTW